MDGGWLIELRTIGIVAVAGALGAAIGAERERAAKPAGLRTHMLVAGAAAMLMSLGRIMVQQAPEWFAHEGASVQALRADPVRILQAIILGVSFLGAGTIIVNPGQRVAGLTTAGTILLTTGIGIAVALEQFVLAGGVTLLTLAVLFGFRLLQKLLRKWGIDPLRRGNDDER